MTTEQEADLVYRTITAMFPDVSIKADAGPFWRVRLQTLSDPVVLKRAVNTVLDTARRFPRFSEIREAYSAQVGGVDFSRNMSPRPYSIPESSTGNGAKAEAMVRMHALSGRLDTASITP